MKPSRTVLSLLLALTIGLASCNLPAGQTSAPGIATPSTQALPAASGVIGGMVWHDVCPASATAPNPIPPGCMPNGAGGTAANGVRDLDEPGIPGAQVLLHANDCISPSIATTITDGGGMYKFPNLAAGSYCVTIDANTPPNTVLLMPGTWSKPTSPTFFVQQMGTLADGATLTFDFAWDFQNQPVQPPISQPISTIAPPLVTQTPSGTFFVVDTPANCRSGPDTTYAVVTTYPQGQFLTPVGRNADSSWWYVQVSSTKNCWISSIVGHVTGNAAVLPVFTAAPSPTPSPTLTPTATQVGSDTTPPSLSDPIVVYTDIYYPASGCGSNLFNVAIHASDANLDSVWLTYRFVSNSGYVGAWNTLSPNDSASGGLNGFKYNLGSQAATELGGKNGKIQYQFYAKDKAGNEASFPASGVLKVTIKYCP